MAEKTIPKCQTQQELSRLLLALNVANQNEYAKSQTHQDAELQDLRSRLRLSEAQNHTLRGISSSELQISQETNAMLHSENLRLEQENSVLRREKATLIMVEETNTLLRAEKMSQEIKIKEFDNTITFFKHIIANLEEARAVNAVLLAANNHSLQKQNNKQSVAIVKYKYTIDLFKQLMEKVKTFLPTDDSNT